jgi:hypothetical protein
MGKPAVALLALLALAQLYPSVSTGDAALTGAGHVVALNMLDARVQCVGAVFLRQGNTTIHVNARPARTGIRIACEPHTWLETARALCDDGIQADLFLAARRTTSLSFEPTLTRVNACPP